MKTLGLWLCWSSEQYLQLKRQQGSLVDLKSSSWLLVQFSLANFDRLVSQSVDQVRHHGITHWVIKKRRSFWSSDQPEILSISLFCQVRELKFEGTQIIIKTLRNRQICPEAHHTPMCCTHWPETNYYNVQFWASLFHGSRFIFQQNRQVADNCFYNPVLFLYLFLNNNENKKVAPFLDYKDDTSSSFWVFSVWVIWKERVNKKMKRVCRFTNLRAALN